MRVALCTPCRSGTVHHQHMLSAMDTRMLAARKSIQWRHYTAPGCSVLPRVRNRLVSAALADGCDWVVFVDDDIAWDAADFFRLMEHGEKVVGAAPAKRHKRWDEQPAAVFAPLDGDIPGKVTSAGTLWEVKGLATAFLAIHASVFRELEDMTQAYWSEGAPHETRNWFWFDLQTIDGRFMDEGEDYHFCRKWREIGGRCFVDPHIRLRHYDGNVCHDFCAADLIMKEAA